MNRILKKLLTLTLCVAMALSLFCATGVADEDYVKLRVWHYDWTGAGNIDENVKAEAELVNQVFKDTIGVDVEMIWPPQGNEMESLSLLLATGEQVDLFMVFPNEFRKWQSQNLFLPLDELVDQYGPNVKSVFSEDELREASDSEGTLWGIPCSNTAITATLSIRQDWLDELNLELPRTIADLEEILAAFKEKNPESYPMLDGGLDYSAGIDLGPQVLAGAFTPYGNNWWLDEDGTLLPPEMHPEYKDYLATMQAWYKAGYIHPDSYSLGESAMNSLIANGEAGVYIHWYTNMIASNEAIYKLENPDLADSEYAAIKHEDLTHYLTAVPWALEGPGGYSGVTAGKSTQYYYVVNKRCEHPDKAMEFINLYLSLDYYKTAYNGIEGRHVDYTYYDDGTCSYAAKEVVLEDGTITWYPWIYYHLVNCAELDQYMVGTTYYARESMRNKMDVLKNPLQNPLRAVDIDVPYNLTETANVINDITTYRKEAWVSVVTGQEDVEWWDTAMDIWRDIGMQIQIDERTAQYHAAMGD